MDTQYLQSIEYLLSFTNLELKPGTSLNKKDFSLESITSLLEKIGNPHHDFKPVHVAGSKGKGSTSAIIESALRKSGKKTGLFTSPHLIDYTERFRIDGSSISRIELINAIEFLKPFIEEVPGIQTFEIMTAIAFKIFSDKQVDFAVVEVGLGGRLDSTNVLKPTISVITPIFLEHTYVLGDSIGQIAAEKGGIIKASTPTVISHQPNQQAYEVFDRLSSSVGSRLIRTTSNTQINFKSYSDHKMNITWEHGGQNTLISTSLLGVHQIQNVQTAITTLEELGISPNKIIKGIESVSWPARFDIRELEDQTYIFDVSHIPESMKALLETYNQVIGNKADVVFGSSNDKNIEDILKIISPIIDTLIITKADHPRAATVSRIEKIAVKLDINHVSVPSVPEALRVKSENKLPVLVTGSFYVVGEAMDYLGIKI